jgi:hypothetical protein
MTTASMAAAIILSFRTHLNRYLMFFRADNLNDVCGLDRRLVFRERYDVGHQPARGLPERCNIAVFSHSINELGANVKIEQKFRSLSRRGGQ